MSFKQETEMAKLYNGKRSPSSGAQPHDRGDVRYRVRTGDDLYEHEYDFTGECKATRTKSMTIRKETWEKIAEEAEEQGRRPCMFIRFLDQQTGRKIDLIIRSVEDDREMF
jgi:Holliday junction resolvase